MLKGNEKTGMLAAFISNLIFGMSNFFSVIALKYTEPMVVLSLRFTAAFFIICVLRVCGLVKINLKSKHKSGLILMCIAQPFVYFICELYGISLTSSAMSGVIVSMTPVAVIVLSSIFLKEKANWRQVLFAFISVIGVIAVNILNDSSGQNYIAGIIILLVAVIAAAVFNILSRKEADNFSPMERVYVMFGISTIGFNIVCFGLYSGKYFNMLKNAFLHTEFLVAILYLSAISSIVAFFLYNYATSHVDVIKASSFSNIIPVVSIISGIALLKENFNIKQIICSLFIIMGVWGVNYFGLRKI